MRRPVEPIRQQLSITDDGLLSDRHLLSDQHSLQMALVWNSIQSLSFLQIDMPIRTIDFCSENLQLRLNPLPLLRIQSVLKVHQGVLGAIDSHRHQSLRRVVVSTPWSSAVVNHTPILISEHPA